MGNFIVFIGAICGTIGAAFYIIDTLKGKTQPNRVTWLLWSITSFIALAAALSKGISWSAFPVFIIGLTSILTFFSSFVNPKAYWKLGRKDYICGLLSILALVLWGITSDANIAILFSILSDLAATLPTVIKAWKSPESESSSAYFGGLINSLSTFFVVKTWAFAEIGFVSYNILIILVILIAIYIKRPAKKKKKKKSKK